MSNNFDGPVLIDDPTQGYYGFGRAPGGEDSTRSRILVTTGDPSAGAGLAAPVGSLAIRDDVGSVELFQKTALVDIGWTQIAGGGGTVAGPGASTDTALASWNGVAGNLLRNNVVLLSAAGDLTGIRDITMSRNLTVTADSQLTLNDNSATALQIGAAGALTMLVFDTSNAAEIVNVNASFQIGSGAISTIPAATNWSLIDNNATALQIGPTGGPANLLVFDTTNGNETITTNAQFNMSGGATVTTGVLNIAAGAGFAIDGGTMTSAGSLQWSADDNNATSLQIGSAGALTMLTWDTTNGAESLRLGNSFSLPDSGVVANADPALGDPAIFLGDGPDGALWYGQGDTPNSRLNVSTLDNGAGDTDDIEIGTGVAVGGDSGDVRLVPGTATGTSGDILAKGSNERLVIEKAGSTDGINLDVSATSAKRTVNCADADVELGGGYRILSRQVTDADLTAGATAQQINFTDDIPARAVVVGAWFDLDTVFSGGGSASAVVDVGDGTDDDGYVDAEDIFTGASTGQRSTPVNPPALLAENGVDVSDALRTPSVTITSDVNVNLLTAGDLTAYILYVEMPQVT